MRFLIALLLLAAPASAATITVVPASGNSPAVIGVQGKMLPEDIDDFRLKIGNLSNAVVAFESDGGDLLAGIKIGQMIRLRSFATMVPPGVRCASACAIAWLGGKPRFMGEPALVGFHAAYREGATGKAESGMGNAVLGAYLNSLGLSEGAIAYITVAAPDEMTWLTLQEAARHGIEVRSLQGNTSSAPSTVKTAEPKQRVASVPEDTHGLLGTWQCAGIETQTSSYKSNQYRINGVIQITKFDGKYYWAEGMLGATPVGNSPPLPTPVSRQTVKQKFWFEGGKLYRSRYWRSDAMSQEAFDTGTIPVKLQDNVMILNHTFHVTYNGTDWSVHSSSRCAK